MIRGIQNVTIPAVNYATAQSGKMSLPVDSSSLIYSHFEHVSGIPAPKGTQGVTISKLNLLDVLIEQLNQVKRTGSIPVARPANTAEIPEKSLDSLIETYKNQVKQAKAASAAMPYIQSPSAQSGALFSLIA